MRGILLFLCMVSCLVNAFSQNRIYLRPSIEIKRYISHSEVDNVIRTPYYEYKINRLGWLGGLELGLTIGYSFNKNRSLLETGIHTENTESGWTMNFFNYEIDPGNSNNTYVNRMEFGSACGSVGKKIPILFSTQIKKWNVHIYQPTPFAVCLNLVAGVNYFYQNTGIIPFNSDPPPFMPSPTIRMDSHTTIYALRANSILYEAGISIDLCKRQREWFTLTLYYMRGFHNLSTERLDITLTEITTNNITAHYQYNSYGQGSALILAISKKVFFTKLKSKD